VKVDGHEAKVLEALGTPAAAAPKAAPAAKKAAPAAKKAAPAAKKAK
jgi:hypothetical protein